MKAHILGYPRIGAQRELKFASEQFWKGDLTLAELQQVAKQLRGQHWLAQKSAGLDYVSVGDFSLYDQVLDHAVLLGAIPARFGFDPATSTPNSISRWHAVTPSRTPSRWPRQITWCRWGTWGRLGATSEEWGRQCPNNL